MQKKQMNEKEVYRAAKLRELINKERGGDGVPTLSNKDRGKTSRRSSFSANHLMWHFSKRFSVLIDMLAL